MRIFRRTFLVFSAATVLLGLAALTGCDTVGEDPDMVEVEFFVSGDR